MNAPHVAFAFVLGLLANSLAEIFLAIDLKRPFADLPSPCKTLRIARWCICCIGLVALRLFNPSPLALIALALFSVTAATDLETKRIPPDWFSYGCVVLLCAMGFATGGMAGLRDGVVAQAMCFVAMVFAIVFARAASPGDVKVLMHYGATCGTLPAVGVGIIAETLARIGVLVMCIMMMRLRGKPLRTSLHRGLHLRLPHAPIAWVGVWIALAAKGLGLV